LTRLIAAPAEHVTMIRNEAGVFLADADMNRALLLRHLARRDAEVEPVSPGNRTSPTTQEPVLMTERARRGRRDKRPNSIFEEVRVTMRADYFAGVSTNLLR
jgi:hypothetical protein